MSPTTPGSSLVSARTQGCPYGCPLPRAVSATSWLWQSRDIFGSHITTALVHDPRATCLVMQSPDSSLPRSRILPAAPVSTFPSTTPVPCVFPHWLSPGQPPHPL